MEYARQAAGFEAGGPNPNAQAATDAAVAAAAQAATAANFASLAAASDDDYPTLAAFAAKARYASIAAKYFTPLNTHFTIGSLVTLALEDLDESAQREVLKTVYNGVAC